MSLPLHWLSPGDPTQRTGGFIYNARVIDSLRAAGREVVVHVLEGAWPWPQPSDVVTIREQLDRIPDGEPVLADGLLWPGLGPGRAALLARCPVVVLVHSLLDKEGEADADRIAEVEAEALSEVHGWIATSGRTADLVRERVGMAPAGVVAVPGCDPAPQALGSGGTRLLCVATLTPRKGHAVLLEALAGLTDIEWTLHCAGSMDRDRDCTAAVQQDIARLGLSDRVTLVGELDDDALGEAYAATDVLVHGASFEGYGMGLAEALVRGIPVVSTPAGALDDVPSSAAVVVEPGDVAAMRTAIGRLLQHDDARGAMAVAARAVHVPTWDEVAVSICDAVDGFGVAR